MSDNKKLLLDVDSLKVHFKIQGRGQYVMEPSHYEPVPKNIADQIIAGRTKA